MELADRIYEIIEEKHLKQSSIATAAGFTPKIFNSMLRKRKMIRPEHIVPICKALGVTPNELFGFDMQQVS